MTTRKAVTVNSNYHVAFGGAWYSVPFTYANKSVEVVATKDTVAVVADSQRIAMHQRVREGQSPSSTKQSHMPESHREFLAWNGERFRAEAAEVGPSCSEVMASILTSHRVEQQAHRNCKGLISLAKTHGRAMLEQACAKALSYTKNPSYKTVKSVIPTIIADEARTTARICAATASMTTISRPRRALQMTKESTMDRLHQMRMSVMARAYLEQEEAPGVEEMTFDERFAMLVDAEWDSRRSNKRVRLLRAAGLAEPGANVMDVRYDADRKLDKGQVRELANCSWIRDRRNLVITGASGAGKTWMGCALGMAECNNFYTVRYMRLPEMLDDLCTEKNEEWLKRKKRHIKCDLLIIDDWLLENAKANEAREILEVIVGRSRTSSTMLCSQFGTGA